MLSEKKALKRVESMVSMIQQRAEVLNNDAMLKLIKVTEREISINKLHCCVREKD